MPRPRSRLDEPALIGPAFRSEREAAPAEQRIAWLEAEVSDLVKLCRRLVEHVDYSCAVAGDLDNDVAKLKRLIREPR